MTTPHSTAHAPGPGHEQTDANVRSIMIASLILGAIVVASMIGIAFLLLYYDKREARRSAPASPLAASYGRQVPPEPRLQADPLGDLHALRAEEEELLDGYGWVDRRAGKARNPIARAIDILAERNAGKAPGGRP
jgi:hypothetical protein